LRVIAHRGASRRAPENTLAAVRAAIDDGADGVEVDVRATRDGHLVLMHDRRLDRTTSGRGRLDAWRLGDVRALDAGAWFGPAFAGERVPTLEQLLDLAQPSGLEVMLDMKDAQRSHLVAGLLSGAVAERGMRSRVTVLSDSAVWLDELGKVDPGIRRGLLGHPGAVDLATATRLAETWALHWSVPLFRPGLMAAARARGLRVLAWTVDSPPLLRRMRRIGPDGVITNEPAGARRRLAP